MAPTDPPPAPEGRNYREEIMNHLRGIIDHYRLPTDQREAQKPDLQVQTRGLKQCMRDAGFRETHIDVVYDYLLELAEAESHHKQTFNELQLLAVVENSDFTRDDGRELFKEEISRFAERLLAGPQINRLMVQMMRQLRDVLEGLPAAIRTQSREAIASTTATTTATQPVVHVHLHGTAQTGVPAAQGESAADRPIEMAQKILRRIDKLGKRAERLRGNIDDEALARFMRNLQGIKGTLDGVILGCLSSPDILIKKDVQQALSTFKHCVQSLRQLEDAARARQEETMRRLQQELNEMLQQTPAPPPATRTSAPTAAPEGGPTATERTENAAEKAWERVQNLIGKAEHGRGFIKDAALAPVITELRNIQRQLDQILQPGTDWSVPVSGRKVKRAERATRRVAKSLDLAEQGARTQREEQMQQLQQEIAQRQQQMTELEQRSQAALADQRTEFQAEIVELREQIAEGERQTQEIRTQLEEAGRQSQGEIGRLQNEHQQQLQQRDQQNAQLQQRVDNFQRNPRQGAANNAPERRVTSGSYFSAPKQTVKFADHMKRLQNLAGPTGDGVRAILKMRGWTGRELEQQPAAQQPPAAPTTPPSQPQQPHQQDERPQQGRERQRQQGAQQERRERGEAA